MVLSILLLLPSELKWLIAELSPRNSLVALARTHSSYQSIAEKALYNTLYIYANSDNSLTCMETLAKNSEKAALVRFLTIEYANCHTKKNRRMTSYLSKSLINMHSLSDFRVKSCVGGAESQSIMGLGKILCEGHLRLQTYYCPDVPNLSRVIKSQTELKLLGLYRYTAGPPRNVLKTLRELHDAQLFLPIIFTSESRRKYSRRVIVPWIILSIFPAFYSVNRRATIPQVLAQSFCNARDNFKNYLVTELSIYLIDSSDMPSIYTLVKGMAVSFRRIDQLNLWFERRCEIPPHEIKENFSFLRGVTITIDVWPTA